jgi:hypothetical protein
MENSFLTSGKGVALTKEDSEIMSNMWCAGKLVTHMLGVLCDLQSKCTMDKQHAEYNFTVD